MTLSGALRSATSTGAEAISTIQQNRIPRGKTAFREVSVALAKYHKVKEIRAAGIAGAHVARPIAHGLSEMSGRCGYASLRQ